MSNQPIKNQAYTFYLSLVSQSTGQFQANPTLAAGDVKVLIDDGAPANITTLPEVDADYTRRVKVSLSASEMNGDKVCVYFVDAAGSEWDEAYASFDTISWLDTNDDITGLSTLTAAGIRSAVGLASANLDTQLSGIQADTNDIQTRLPAALSGDGFIKADLKSIEDELTSGNNATLNLKQLSIQNSSGGRAVILSSDANDAIFISAGGNGIYITAGEVLYAESIFGTAIEINAAGNGDALYLAGAGTGKSINAPNDIAVSDGDLTLTAIANKVLASVIETGYTLKQSMRLMLSALAGKLSGAATTTVTIRDATDNKNRIVATVDSSGNRTAVTHDTSD